MVKNGVGTHKGEQTRTQILQSALQLFREKGFDSTTMQDVADRANSAKSAAYYYFPSKEAIIQAYYYTLQDDHERITSQELSQKMKLKDRLALVFQSKFDLVQGDRKLLGVVFRYTGEPEHPLSCLGPATKDLRLRSIRLFRSAIELEKLPEDLLELLPVALWSLQMGLLVMFLYDSSKQQARTRRMCDGSLDLTVKLLGLAKLGVLKPIRTKVLALLREADLLPTVQEG